MRERRGRPRESPIEAFGQRLSGSVEKWMPDPFIFAVFLTIIVFVMGIAIEGVGPYEMIQNWWGGSEYPSKGFWSLLGFAMQMCLILVTGYALAHHPWVHGLLVRLTKIPKNGKQAAALIAFISLAFSWINWGLGLILGALFAKEMGIQAYKRGMKVHYPMLAVAGYTGLGLIWHWGLSASAQLTLAAEGNWAINQGWVDRLIPVSETLFTPYSFAMSGIMLVFGVLVCYLLHPSNPDRCRGIEEYAPGLLEEEERKEEKEGKRTMADKLESSPIIALIVGTMMLICMIWWFKGNGIRGLNLNSVNFIFIMVGLLLYMNPIKYVKAIMDAAGAVGGIIIQFPLYAGIQGMMMLSGLGATIAVWLARIASPATFPVVAWLTAGLVNLFIPSGGGEFAVVGPTLFEAGESLGVPVCKTVTAFAAGDQWSNLFQPFWAIALLSITGLRARDIFGFCIAIMLIAVIPIVLGLTFIPF